MTRNNRLQPAHAFRGAPPGDFGEDTLPRSAAGAFDGDDPADLPVVHTLGEFMAMVRMACEARHSIAGLRSRALHDGC